MNRDYKRVLNTYYINLTERNDIRGDDGCRAEFMFQLPVLPQLPNTESKTAILRILSCHILNVSDADNAEIAGGFYIKIDGISVRPQSIGSLGVNSQLLASNMFFIPNNSDDQDFAGGPIVHTVVAHQIAKISSTGLADGALNVPQHTITDTAGTTANGQRSRIFGNSVGSQLSCPYEVICGNPSGNTARISLYDVDGDVLVAQTGNINEFKFILQLAVELIDPDEDQNF